MTGNRLIPLTTISLVPIYRGIIGGWPTHPSAHPLGCPIHRSLIAMSGMPRPSPKPQPQIGRARLVARASAWGLQATKAGFGAYTPPNPRHPNFGH